MSRSPAALLLLAALGVPAFGASGPPCDPGPKAIQEWKGIDARHPSFHQPTLITVDPMGNVFILEGRRILQFSPEGIFQKTYELPEDCCSSNAMAASDSFLYVSDGGWTYQFFKDGSIAQWNFGSCENGLAVDRHEHLFVSAFQKSTAQVIYVERQTSQAAIQPRNVKRLDILPKEERRGIWKLSSQGEVLDHWEAPSWPIALGKDGTIYAVDPDTGGRFLRIDHGRSEIKSCRLGLKQIMPHRSLAVSPAGHLFVNDRDRIVETDGNGKVVRRWCDAEPAYDPLDCPAGLTVDARGNLYVVDYFKSRVLKFDLGTN